LSAIATITRSNALLAPRGRQASRKPQAARTTHRTNVIPKPRQKTVHRHPQITTLIPHTLALKDETGMKPG